MLEKATNPDTLLNLDFDSCNTNLVLIESFQTQSTAAFSDTMDKIDGLRNLLLKMQVMLLPGLQTTSITTTSTHTPRSTILISPLPAPSLSRPSSNQGSSCSSDFSSVSSKMKQNKPCSEGASPPPKRKKGGEKQAKSDSEKMPPPTKKKETPKKNQGAVATYKKKGNLVPWKQHQTTLKIFFHLLFSNLPIIIKTRDY